MKLFLTSSPIGIYRSEEPLDYNGFNPANGMVETLKEFWTENARCLLVSAFPDQYELDDRMREDYENIVKDTGLSISCMDICDLRNGKEKADELGVFSISVSLTHDGGMAAAYCTMLADGKDTVPDEI